MSSAFTPEEWRSFDATALAALIREGEAQPIELVDTAIAAIERLDPQLNAVVTPLFDQARDAATAPGLPREGPFPGVPFLLKDLVAQLAGARYTGGSDFPREYIAPADSELVRRMKRAGLIFVGKSNTSEFGLLPTAETRRFGPAHNPWDLGRSTGGSSGGSAAAVAAGLVPMGHANDGGGSIRIPASCCGLFGLKPTRARNPLGPQLGDGMGGLICEHAVTRSVRDSAALLDATAGPDVGDPYAAPPPARPYMEELGRPPGRLRIAFSTRAANGAPVHDACVVAVQAAAKLCAELGHVVEEAAPALDGDELNRIFGTIWSAGTAWTIEELARATGERPTPEAFEPLTWIMAERGWKRNAAQYLTAIAGAQAVGRAVARFQADWDVLLTPTLAQPPLTLGTLVSPPDDPLRGMVRAAAWVPFTPLANLTGQPAMSVPLHWSSDGLPVGVQFAGRFGDEGTLFRLAAQLETAAPWAERRPPVSA